MGWKNLHYWWRCGITFAIISAILSKVYYFLLLIFWSDLPLLHWIINWPSILFGVFPYIYDSAGAPVVSFGKGLIDPISLIVNAGIYFLIGAIIGYLLARPIKGKLKSKKSNKAK
ncbi:MAG: hypothetical protein AABW80_00085 [Nanoarchaeota archaeon]